MISPKAIVGQMRGDMTAHGVAPVVTVAESVGPIRGELRGTIADARPIPDAGPIADARSIACPRAITDTGSIARGRERGGPVRGPVGDRAGGGTGSSRKAGRDIQEPIEIALRRSPARTTAKPIADLSPTGQLSRSITRLPLPEKALSSRAVARLPATRQLPRAISCLPTTR